MHARKQRGSKLSDWRMRQQRCDGAKRRKTHASGRKRREWVLRRLSVDASQRLNVFAWRKSVLSVRGSRLRECVCRRRKHVHVEQQQRRHDVRLLWQRPVSSSALK